MQQVLGEDIGKDKNQKELNVLVLEMRGITFFSEMREVRRSKETVSEIDMS
jgi:hypothetical protein